MISVIIPTLNEEQRIGKLLPQISQLLKSIPHELIVVDGGSSDQTIQQAESFAATYQLPKGNRGAQLHYGAEQSRGDFLWFLHSDSELEIESTELVKLQHVLRASEYSAAFFQLSFDSSDKFFAYLAWTSSLRARFLGLIFGDQGLFVTRECYQQVGGFDAIPLMEDWQLSRRLRKIGQFYPAIGKISTSSRRFRKGKLRTHLAMHHIKLLYLLGMSPEKLAKRYYK
ncbi:TIGR04283 family arsenosugar biosynthesis glycosyltransferase [Enterococcus viikkiensis]|uniref:TIGR04283 family arsenosugar biosynthesis glycosyltransferase n=1 Tax=Enterococcus viikkiensis TaxID=930854 RepID=UPI003F8DF975